ncbi:hypothetical protein RUM44_010447 [Polyplax serrata]|uniref:Uncharacterized protein n=1 Tax=Polyplax serrata TaxID=468196 RepID=A0ABR1AVL9_POLSC
MSVTCRNSVTDEAPLSTDQFVREYNLDNDQGTLYLIQKFEGDVHCVVWDAALLLAKYLEKRCLTDGNFLEGKRVIELGSGLGCVGMVASFYGGHVTLTDLAQAMPLLKLNVRNNQKLLMSRNKFAAKVELLDWNEDISLEPCDVLLASDCVYYKESIPGLVKALRTLSKRSTEIYLSQENRSHSEIQTGVFQEFMKEVNNVFKVEAIPPSEQHEEFRSPDIYLFRLMKL